jgi:8-oxo-dGTP pyrophosphatase MutT (NUDIX family)
MHNSGTAGAAPAWLLPWTVLNRNPWRTLDSRIAYENAWIRVREDRVLRPDGQPGIYGVIEIRPSIGVVALNGRDELVLVGQWRYPLERYSWEIPRGGSGPGETDMAAVAARELREETGVTASDWQSLGAVDVNNGVTTDIEHLFLATGLETGEPAPCGDERIATRWVPLADAVRMVLTGEITECCSAAAIGRLALMRGLTV